MEAKKLGGGLTARKSPIGSTNNQWGMNKTPLIKVSLYVLAHDKHLTKRIADDTNTNTIGVKEQGLGTSIINFFSKKGDELRNQMEEMGLSKEEANLYEEKLDQGRILLLVTAETPTASDRQTQNYHSL